MIDDSILVNFIQDNSGWIKCRINASTSDYYLREEIYGHFLLELTERFIKNDAKDFIGYAKIMGVNASSWYLRMYSKKNKKYVYDSPKIDRLEAPNLIENTNYVWEEMVKDLITKLQDRKAFGIIKNLKARIDHPEKSAKELVGLIDGQKYDTILQHFTNLRKMIKDGKIKIDKIA